MRDGTDCDDSEPFVNPGQDEICNDHRDNDCDGTANECGLPLTLYSWAAPGILDVPAVGGGHLGVAGLGEANGDSFGDLAVAAGGTAYILLGGFGAGEDVVTQATSTIEGTLQVAGGFDLDDDDRGDAVGLGTEVLWVLYGGAGIMSTTMPDRSFEVGGVAVSGAQPDEALAGGDVDGDALADVVVGASGLGSVSVLRSPLPKGGAVESLADSVYTAAVSDGLGRSVSVAHDIDGDGLGDLVLGAPGISTVYVIPGDGTGIAPADAAAGAALQGQSGDRTGATTGAADLDGDGYDDVVVGAPDAGDGTVYAWFGPVPEGAELVDSHVVIASEDVGAGFGDAHRVSAGDLTADGLADLAVGAPLRDRTVADEGTTFIFVAPLSGSYGSGDADSYLLGDAPESGVGATVDVVGDVSNDGFDDLATGLVLQGQVYLMHGEGL